MLRTVFGGEPARLVALAAVLEQRRRRRASRSSAVSLSSGQSPERRDDVQVDVAPVRVVGARPDLRLLDRQPPLDEVDAERRLVGRHRLAVLAALHQLGDELLGVALAGTGLDPPALLLAGRRIDAVVDHRVVAVALLRYVAAHRPSLRFNRKGRQAAAEAGPEASIGCSALLPTTIRRGNPKVDRNRSVDASVPRRPARRAARRGPGARPRAVRTSPHHPVAPVPFLPVENPVEERWNRQQKGPPR